MGITRRSVVGGALGLPLVGAEVLGEPQASRGVREYHLSVAWEAIGSDPELLSLVRGAGVTTLWFAAFFNGQWPAPLEKPLALRRRLADQGVAVHFINIPLGHPYAVATGPSGAAPAVQPGRWRPAMRADGTWYMGTSLHPPAVEQNVAAMKRLQDAGITRVFLDDDFRLATGPGGIGGCFCEDHRRAFLRTRGYPETRWGDLAADVKRRALTPILREWIDFTCDELTGCFRAQQRAAPRVQLGNMVMFMGAEKAGIRLVDYRGVPLRVGELMFDDVSFGTVKAKTQELFSSLFHRRFVRPDGAYSETTAYPEDRLSAANMAAKLAVSTLSDVRRTMYMSGLTPFPRAHWSVLGAAMRKHAAIHARIAGHRQRGPLKHYWGERGRWVSDDNAYSLFLAMGVPFDVTAEPAATGWTFLGDHDAIAAAEGAIRSRGTVFVCRPEAGVRLNRSRTVAESLPALYALKREIVQGLTGVPHVEQDVPVVCAWYPTARSVLLWNLTESRQHVTVRLGTHQRPVVLGPLDAELVEEISKRA